MDLSELDASIRQISEPGRTDRAEITVQGAYGAARAVVWQHAGQAIGVIGIHGIMPRYEGQEPQECDIPGMSHCYDADVTFRGGFGVAEMYYAGTEDLAVAEVESWYRARLDPAFEEAV